MLNFRSFNISRNLLLRRAREAGSQVLVALAEVAWIRRIAAERAEGAAAVDLVGEQVARCGSVLDPCVHGAEQIEDRSSLAAGGMVDAGRRVEADEFIGGRLAPRCDHDAVVILRRAISADRVVGPPMPQDELAAA